jgi:demethylmenaquinone methyltransferase/2-methoxy-6-polyprenyl-1,4-benzoquinol methylase
MLDIAKEKVIKLNMDSKISFSLGDSENLPFENTKFDAITVSFGVRNFENLEKGLTEMLRVLKPSGKLVILEFSNPTNPIVKFFYSFYFRYILPTIGKLISKDNSAYTYLPESVKHFPDGERFLTIMNSLGYKNTKCETLTFGIASIYVGSK